MQPENRAIPTAEEHARRAAALEPHNPLHWLKLGIALNQQRRWAEAAQAYQRAIAGNPNEPALWQALGSALLDAGQFDEAEPAFERSLALAPGGEATSGYAYLLARRGENQKALDVLHVFLARAPQSAVGWMVLGNVSEVLGNLAEAENACRRALAIAPGLCDARYQLAGLLLRRREPFEAEECARALLAEHPQHALGWSLLGKILRARAAHDESLACLRHALALQSDAATHSRLLAGMQFAEGVDCRQLLDAHQQWDAAHARPLFNGESPARGPATGKLTLGFVSPDFGKHPVGFLVLPALERLDKSGCSVVCYSDRQTDDQYTGRFRAAADAWHSTDEMSDEALAGQIRADKIDILFDLTGHWGRRLLVFARKPAPVQVTWLGYVGTTGLSAIDYLLADRHHVPPGEESCYSEKVLRMPQGYACYGPPDDAPKVGPLPALSSQMVTFGCFNSPAKYTSHTLDAWAAILSRVPASRLLLKYFWLQSSAMKQSVQAEFERRGVASGRIILESGSSTEEMLAAYQRVDLALDTQPYSGGLTTCEALWMGVPVITWPGQTFAGRHSTSHLKSAGFPQFIAHDRNGYIELAVHWAARLNELAAIRAGMREQVRNSPLCNATVFAQDFLKLMQQTWLS